MARPIDFMYKGRMSAHGASVNAIEISPNGCYVVFRDENGNLEISTTFPHWKRLRLFRPQHTVRSISWHPSPDLPRTFAFATANGCFYIITFDEHNESYDRVEFFWLEAYPHAFTIDPNDGFLAIAFGNSIKVYQNSFKPGNLKKSLSNPTQDITVAADIFPSNLSNLLFHRIRKFPRSLHFVQRDGSSLLVAAFPTRIIMWAVPGFFRLCVIDTTDKFEYIGSVVPSVSRETLAIHAFRSIFLLDLNNDLQNVKASTFVEHPLPLPSQSSRLVGMTWLDNQTLACGTTSLGINILNVNEARDHIFAVTLDHNCDSGCQTIASGSLEGHAFCVTAQGTGADTVLCVAVFLPPGHLEFPPRLFPSVKGRDDSLPCNSIHILALPCGFFFLIFHILVMLIAQVLQPHLPNVICANQFAIASSVTVVEWRTTTITALASASGLTAPTLTIAATVTSTVTLPATFTTELFLPQGQGCARSDFPVPTGVIEL
ncbi:hypothetical protein FA15DRAFT_710708 [Coprinopsis marcescibilis]|uniref:WD40 repeat-like protein n=1 Tax=Coprinopsis marcescibilis TaxID=230819 RepID=A0A5C3KC55_COPMA|nr:hypothetical protein FA15DRAFT_710708 [Coprinopsis marcescibilis]